MSLENEKIINVEKKVRVENAYCMVRSLKDENTYCNFSIDVSDDVPIVYFKLIGCTPFQMDNSELGKIIQLVENHIIEIYSMMLKHMNTEYQYKSYRWKYISNLGI